MISKHYYRQFEYDIDQFMQDVYYGTKPYKSFISKVWKHVEKEEISFTVKKLENAPHFEELQTALDKTTDDSEKNKLRELLSGYWYEVIESEKLTKNRKLMEMIFSQKYVYTKYNNGNWDKNDKIKVYDSNQSQGVICLEKESRGKSLYIKPNVVQFQRISNAIEKLINTPSYYHLPLLRLFKTDRYAVDWPEFHIDPIKKYYYLESNKSGVDIQKEFVEIALATPDFAFLNGPPGTGKTQVICEIIFQEILKGNKVMLVASTHVAVDNVLERLMAFDHSKEIILPLRIGDEGKVSRGNKDYLYNRIANTEHSRIIRNLVQIPRTNSQDILYEAMHTDKSIFKNDLLDIANLVCGTTIGIMRYPKISEFKQGKSRPLFDIMILDEASKTPFYEFIVPAIWAKKWILTGDPLQLSPYVDELDLISSLNSVIDQIKNKHIDKSFALDSLVLYLPLKNPEKINNSRRYSKGSNQRNTENFHVIVIDDENLYMFHEAHVRELKIKYPDYRILVLEDLVEYHDNQMLVEVMLYSSQFILANKENLQIFAESIPSDVTITLISSSSRSSDNVIPVSLKRRATCKTFSPTDDDRWINQISYRLGRRYELRNDPDAQEYKREEIDKLIYPDVKFKQAIREVEQVFFPSVLESLLEGFERVKEKWGSTITDGLPPDARDIRFRMLEYQHRMHPDISKFIREAIYKNESMKDAEGMRENRAEWRKGERMTWTNVKRSKVGNNIDKGRRRNTDRSKSQDGKELTENIDEVNEVIYSLLEFINWAKNSGREYSVAILTFYKDQERALRHSLRNKFNQPNRTRYFSSPPVQIELCTVDRFQGHEADFVILSMVNNTRMGFLNSPNRLNVALSRARYELLIIGNKNYFRNCPSDLLKKLAENTPKNTIYGRNSK